MKRCAGKGLLIADYAPLVSGRTVAALNAPIVQFGVGDFGFAVSQLASASAARRLLL